MNGSKQIEKTKKRAAPLQRSRTQRQKPRRTNNEEFAMTILPIGSPSDPAGFWAYKGFFVGGTDAR